MDNNRFGDSLIEYTDAELGIKPHQPLRWDIIATYLTSAVLTVGFIVLLVVLWP
jgi:hypothetical protein